MVYPDIEAARRLHCSLREIVFHQFGGWKDDDSLGDVQYLCDRAMEAVDDAICQRKLQLVRRHAAELFSDDGHLAWEMENMAGSDVLRLEIIELLDSFRARLTALEALRRAAAPSREHAVPSIAEMRG